VPAATSFADRLQPYVAEWASVAHEQNVVTEHRLHDTAAWVAYLHWYLLRTRTRVTYVPATPPPPPVPDHDRVLPDVTYLVRRDQTANIAVSYDTANILHSYDFSLKHVFLICAQHDTLAEVVRLAYVAIRQCFSWGPQEHWGTYERILAAAMRYSAVVNYTGAVEIPLLPRHPALSSSSASTASSQQTPATFAGGFSAVVTNRPGKYCTIA
jgi:hypothetical protein